MRSCLVLLLALVLPPAAFTQGRIVGPYTLHPIIPGVVRIEDANPGNPAGIHLDEQGKPKGLNNCSDMYLIAGRDQALLIDLSNAITWDLPPRTDGTAGRLANPAERDVRGAMPSPTAVASLQTLVGEEIGSRKLQVTVTHLHGDHTGMLPAFTDDPHVTFWIHADEFAGKDLFPAERTIPTAGHPSLDLGGGFIVDVVEVPGHTDHSTVYFLRGKNLLFSGDAIGSGGGVWLFSADAFARYRQSVDRLIAYIRDPAHGVDESRLRIFGGHYWQARDKRTLTMQYILDMQKLIVQIHAGTAREEEVAFGPYLNRNFISGEAIITWNKADADRLKTE
ncbi:MAG: MBL fold metallo-hydrolase [Opitutaceae bacterium]|nr:MBL fold metallo-hydrolase [Opitutaceae bacterium]